MSYELIVVGASWGGLDAVGRVLADLPADLSAAVVVAQHRSASSVEGGLGALLERRGPLPVRDAEDKDAIEPGHVYLAPPDYHLLVEPGRFSLSTDERVQYARPSIDVLFETAADAYGERLVAVLLTGANEDGAEGMLRVRRAGGCTIAQEPAGAERPEMPQAAIDLGAASCVLPLERIAPYVVALCQGERSAA